MFRNCSDRRSSMFEAMHFGGFRLWILLAGLLFASATLSEPESAGKNLRIAYVEFPPITYRGENGKAEGSFIEITRKVAREAGFEPEFLYLPVTRAYLYLTNGKIDAWPGVTSIPALDGEVLESWASPLPVQLSAWYLEQTPPVDHFDRLLGKTVIVIGGYTYGGLLSWLESEGSIRVTEAPNHRSALDMLKRGRGDYLLDYRQPVIDTLEMPADSMVRESEIRSRNLAWLFSLANPRAALLRDAFDDAYIRLAEKGEVPPLRKLNQGFVVPGFPEQYR
ncbi:transporter substrate-binding domain-containing protein [Marinobacter sp. BW6]|uniref:substrate-binding periplasmic protein n=1 Tax=Marinobacter sp. BW6 TaxID=2592624 RepID=UPI0011DE6E26|nr:transporter substrate-binding domain-containing protein [Marinobacter sp. BW6]TYC56875.1 transporter substrate-binding domain-containing protein [Marinobacter sp. BW6]